MRSIVRSDGVMPVRFMQGLLLVVAVLVLGLALVGLDGSDEQSSQRHAIDVEQVRAASPAIADNQHSPGARHGLSFFEQPTSLAILTCWQPLGFVRTGGLRPLQCAPKTSPPRVRC